MSTTTIAPGATTRKRTTTKAPAKVPAKKAAAKAPARKVAKPAAEKILHTATGRCGQEVFRRFDKVMTHAVDVADSKATKPMPKAGQVWAFFPSEERAKAWAAKRVTEGYDAIVIKAKVVK